MKKILFIIFVIIISHSCKKENLGQPDCDTTNVHWGKIESIAITNCGTNGTACHSHQSQAFNFTYENAVSYSGEILRRVNLPRSDDQRMPVGGPGLSDCDKAVIKAWIKQGARK